MPVGTDNIELALLSSQPIQSFLYHFLDLGFRSFGSFPLSSLYWLNNGIIVFLCFLYQVMRVRSYVDFSSSGRGSPFDIHVSCGACLQSQNNDIAAYLEATLQGIAFHKTHFYIFLDVGNTLIAHCGSYCDAVSLHRRGIGEGDIVRIHDKIN